MVRIRDRTTPRQADLQRRIQAMIQAEEELRADLLSLSQQTFYYSRGEERQVKNAIASLMACTASSRDSLDFFFHFPGLRALFESRGLLIPVSSNEEPDEQKHSFHRLFQQASHALFNATPRIQIPSLRPNQQVLDDHVFNAIDTTLNQPLQNIDGHPFEQLRQRRSENDIEAIFTSDELARYDQVLDWAARHPEIFRQPPPPRRRRRH